MSRVNWKKAINKQSALAVSSYDYEVPTRKISDDVVHSDVPLPTVQYRGDPNKNLEGKRIFDLKIVGVSAIQPKHMCGTNGGVRWVVRCDCGQYEIRTIKALTNKHRLAMMCVRCKVIEKIKEDRRLEEIGLRPVK